MKWFLIDDREGGSGARNMARDYALLRQAIKHQYSFIRFYSFNPPCLSFGRNEPALRRYDRSHIADLDLDTVRRPTGGRAVWHESEITYSIAAPVELFGTLARSYLEIHHVIAMGLADLGIPARLAERPASTPGPGGGACFAQAVGGEIVVNGRKLVGSAQVREGEAFLQHGSILVGNRQDMLSRVSKEGSPRDASVCINELLHDPIQTNIVVEALTCRARQAWPGEWEEMEAPSGDEFLARFADPEWTWRR